MTTVRSRQRLMLLMLTMTTVSLIVASVAIGILYRTALRQTKVRLREIAVTQSSLIEAIPCEDESETIILETLGRFSQNSSKFEPKIEFAIAKRDPIDLQFLWHYSPSSLPFPQPLAWESQTAEPMKRALMGQSGEMQGLDWHGRSVIAAYQPIEQLDWGLVATLPLREVQKPFIKAGWLTLVSALAINLLGIGLIYYLTMAIAQDLERAKQTLNQENEFINSFLETVGSLVIVLNAEGKILRFNRTGETVTHYQEAEVIGQYFWDIFYLPDQRAGVKITFQDVTTPEVPFCAEPYWLTKEGERRYIVWSKTIVRHQADQIDYIIATGIDMTTERQAKQALKQLNQTLEQQVAERTDALQQEILRSHNIMETSPVGIVLLDREGMISMANQRSQQILGIQPQQFSQIDFTAIPHTQWTDYQGNPISPTQFPSQQVQRTGQPIYQFPCCLQWTEDIKSLLSINASPLRDEQQNMTGIILTLEDVTERIQQQQEESSREAKFRAIFDNSVLGMALVNHEQEIIQCNYALASMLGYTTTELTYKHLRDFLSTDDFPLRLSDVSYFATSDDSSLPVEKCLICKDGTKIWVNIFVYVILQEDSLMPLEVVMIEDITERKQAQEKQTKLSRRNEAFIQALGEMVYEHSVPEDRIKWQGEYTKLLGYSSEEMGNDGDSWLSRVHPDDLSRVLEEFERAFADDKIYNLEYRFRHRTGHYIWVHDRGVMFGNAGTQPETVIGILLDVTKRKHREAELRETKEQLDAILSHISDGISVFDANHHLVYVNAALANRIGYNSPEMMLAEYNEDILNHKFELFDENGHPLAPEQLPSYLALQGQRVEPTVIQYHLKKDHKIQWLVIQSSPIFDEQGQVKLVVSIYHDITQLKQIELSLRQSEERYRTIIETVNEGIFMLDKRGEIVFANEIFAQLLNYSLKEIMGASIFNFVDDHNRQKLESSLDALETGEGQLYDLELTVRNGKTIWTTISSSALWDEARNYNGSFSLVTDISQRKQMEEALQDSEEKLRAVLNAIQDSVLLINTQGDMLIANQTVARRLGIPLVNLLFSNFFDYLRSHQELDYLTKITEAIYGGQFVQFEALFYDQEKEEYRNTHNFIYPIKDLKNYITRVAIFSQDITEQKQAEVALQESEERFRILIENIEETLWINDADPSEVLYVSPSYEKIWGRSCESLYQDGSSWLAAVHPDDREAQQRALEQMTQTCEFEQEYRIIRPDNTIRWIYAHVNPIRDEQGTILRYAGIAQDITERKQILEDLEKANLILREWGDNLQQENQEMILLDEITDFLQICQNVEETYQSLGDLVNPLFPNCSGAIFISNHSQTYYEAVSHWGQDLKTTMGFSTSQCWSLRQGHLYLGNQEQPSLFCSHISSSQFPKQSLCLPMIAQGKAIGVFYLNSNQDKPFNQRIPRLAKKVAETLSLSLVNLQLREELRQKSIIDALTGLYNRYYLKESLKREIELAKRKNYSLSIIMIDVDHFKRFNDVYGHDAGDKVLSTLGNYLKSNIRASDVACRYGGEELTLIFPESSLEDSYKRAEALREGIQQLQIEYQNQVLDSVTASFGVAVFPTHALTGEGLMQKADEALYTAKRQGRNQVVIYE